MNVYVRGVELVSICPEIYPELGAQSENQSITHAMHVTNESKGRQKEGKEVTGESAGASYTRSRSARCICMYVWGEGDRTRVRLARCLWRERRQGKGKERKGGQVRSGQSI